MNRFVAFARIGLLGFAAAAVSLSTGCGLDVEVGSSTGSGGHTGAGGSCSNVAVGVGGSGVGGSPSPSAVGVVASSSGVGGSGPGPVFCGGNSPVPIPPCAADEFCDYGPDNCGAFDNQGVCKKRPVGACPPVYEPTCGCNGQIYGSECTANGAGTDVTVNGGCTPPVDTFSCGAHFCDSKTQYCEKTQSDVLEEAPTFACNPLPAGCGGISTCACLAGVACGDTCKDTSNSGHQVTCYVGG